MEAIPVVDLRLLTQAEINALSRVSSSADGDPRRCDEVVVPKIDRSVFNESAGSRKQTYSRLRLAPRKPPELSPAASASPSSSSGATRGRRRAGGLLHPPPNSAASTSFASPLPPLPAPAAVDDPCRRENEQIILFLRQLFAKKGIEIAGKAAAPEESAAVPSAGVITNPTPMAVGSSLGKRGREQEATEAFEKEREVMHISGMAADVVGLGEAEDPFGPELRRRTQGLVTEADFLSFLSGLEGQWGSRRKRRRIVDADKLGDALPKGWKVLLGLKRKEGNIWIHCRRYISPSGKQFMSCKEVSSYLLSFGGSDTVRQQSRAENNANKLANRHVVNHNQQLSVTNPNSNFYEALPISTLSPDSAKQIVLYGVDNSANFQLQDVFRCLECNLTFADVDAHRQHFLTLHRSSRKRRRFGQSLADGVIIRDGKYECQFCHKIFTERRRYTGHVGMHVKYHDRSLEQVTDEVTMDKNINSSTDATAPAFAEHKSSDTCVEQAKLTEENVRKESTHVINDGYPDGHEHVTNTVGDHPMQYCNSEEEKIMVQDTDNVEATDEIKNGFPLRNSSGNDEQQNLIIQEFFPSSKHEKGHGSPGNNVLVEERKDDVVMNCFESGGNSVQEVYEVQCAGEMHANFLPTNKVKVVDFFPVSNNETSGTGIVETDAGMLHQQQKDAVEGGNIVNNNIHIPDYNGLTDVGNCTSESSLRNDFANKMLLDGAEGPRKLNIDHESNAISTPENVQVSVELLTSSQSVVDGSENRENKIFPGSDYKILSGMEQSNKKNTVTVCVAEKLIEMANSDNEPSDVERAHTSSERDAVLENIMPGETRLFLIGERFLESSINVPSGRKFCNVDTTISDMLPSNAQKDMLPSSGEEIVLELMGHSSNGSRDVFMSDGTVHTDAQRNDTGISDEGNLRSLQVNLQTSWQQASVCLPLFQMITDQGDGRLHCANGSHGDISCFEDMRLDDIDPQKLAGPDLRQQLGEPIVDTSGLGNGPCVHLDWDTAFRNLIPRRRFATVCVWCSTEFEHDDVDIEVQPDSVGFMCPTCKAKIPGQM